MRSAALAVVLILAPWCAAEEVIEEVVAVVGRTPLLASDLTLGEIVRLVARDDAEPAERFRSKLLDARIRLELQYRDLERSGVLYRLTLDVDGAHRLIVERSGGAENLAASLAAAGLGDEDLRELALRIAAATAYAEQRLRPAVAVAHEEIVREYERLVADELTPAGVTPPALDEVREAIRRVLEERKLNAELERWTAEAKAVLGVTRYGR